MKVECVGRCGQNAHHEYPDHCKTFMKRIAEPSAGPKMKTQGSAPPQFVLEGFVGPFPL